MEDAAEPIKSFPVLTNKCVIYMNVRQAEPSRDKQMELLKHSSSCGVEEINVLFNVVFFSFFFLTAALLPVYHYLERPGRLERTRRRCWLAASLPSVALSKSHPVFKSNVMDRSLLIEQYQLARQQPDGLDSFRGGRLRDIVLQ